LAVALARLGHALLDRHLVAAGLVDLLGPRAQRAVDPAQVGRVQIPVDVVEGQVAVARLLDEVGEAAQEEPVARPEGEDAVGEGEPLARENLARDGLEIRAPRGRRELRTWGRGGEVRHGIAGFVTGWNGSSDSGATSSTKGVR